MTQVAPKIQGYSRRPTKLDLDDFTEILETRVSPSEPGTLVAAAPIQKQSQWILGRGLDGTQDGAVGRVQGEIQDTGGTVHRCDVEVVLLTQGNSEVDGDSVLRDYDTDDIPTNNDRTKRFPNPIIDTQLYAYPYKFGLRLRSRDGSAFEVDLDLSTLEIDGWYYEK